MAGPNPNAPALQPPGAGLPWWERLAAKYVVFPRACRRLGWAGAAELFQAEGARVLAIWDSLPAGRLAERVLIRRFAGIEDSSRYWSAEMTVEHLTVVGAGIRHIVRSLRRGDAIDRPARVEDVKPRGEAGPAAVRAVFVRLLADVAEEEKVEPPIPPGVGPRHAHPWFGPIDAFRWHALLGIHQGLHRRQLDAIRAGLGAA